MGLAPVSYSVMVPGRVNRNQSATSRCFHFKCFRASRHLVARAGIDKMPPAYDIRIRLPHTR